MLFGLKALAAIGLGFCWGGEFRLIGLTALFPCLWYATSSRLQAAIIAFLYFGSATRGLTFGASEYYDSLMVGLLIWAAGNAILSLVYCICWHKNRFRRRLGACIAMGLSALPPIGVIGWAHPIFATGALLPGFGVSGVVAVFAAIILFVHAQRLSFFVVVVTLFLSQMMASSSLGDKALPFSAVKTLIDYKPGEHQSDFKNALSLKKLVNAQKQGGVLLPELIGGQWSEATKDFWQGVEHPVLLGVEAFEHGKINAIVSSKGGQITYRQRQPIPIAMWRPWDPQSFASHWFQNPVVRVGGRKIAFLVCYESVLVWPALHSLLYKPDFIAVTGNYSWARGTSIPESMASAARLWQAIFGVPLIYSYNT